MMSMLINLILGVIIFLFGLILRFKADSAASFDDFDLENIERSFSVRSIFQVDASVDVAVCLMWLGGSLFVGAALISQFNRRDI